MRILLGTYRLSLNRFNYLVAYLGLIHVLTLWNVFRAGAQISALFIDLVALFSVGIAVTFIGRHLCFPQQLKFSVLDGLVFCFLLYQVVSLVLYLQPNNPAGISSYFYGVHLLVLPIFLYFTTARMTEEEQEKLLRFICYLHILLVVSGLLLFVLRPEFYTDYLRERLASRNVEEIWEIYSRLNSYMGSTAVGLLSAVTIALLPMVKMKKLTKYLLLIIFLLAVLLTQQRGAYVSACVATLFFLFYRNFSIRYLMLVVVLSAVAGYFIVSASFNEVNTLLDYTKNRIAVDLLGGGAFGERSDSYQKGWRLWSEFPFGMGLGATTSAADTGGAHPGGQVVDANYMRILCDIGFLGLIFFLAIVLAAVRSGLSCRGGAYLLVVIFIYCFQATGTNVFDIFYVNHLFWLLLGFVNVQPAQLPAPVKAPVLSVDPALRAG